MVGDDCPSVKLWRTNRGAAATLPIDIDCTMSGGTGISDVAIAAGLVVWIQWERANHLYLDVIATAPGPRLVQRSLLSKADTGGDDDAGFLHAGGGLIVFATYSSDHDPRQGATTTTLWTSHGGTAARIGSAKHLLPLAAERDRIVVWRGGGILQLLNDNGRVLRTITVPATVQAAALSAGDLVVSTPARLTWLTSTGQVRRTWTVEPGARLEGLKLGIARVRRPRRHPPAPPPRRPPDDDHPTRPHRRPREHRPVRTLLQLRKPRRPPAAREDPEAPALTRRASDARPVAPTTNRHPTGGSASRVIPAHWLRLRC